MKKTTTNLLIWIVLFISFSSQAQMLTDTFKNGLIPYGIADPAIMGNSDTIITWEKYTPHELALRGFVPGMLIYGIAYYKPQNGYLPANSTASIDIKFRSGSLDSIIPSPYGLFSNQNYYATTFLTAGFSSWTIFTNGSNFSVPPTTGWQAPLLADVPFVYTGGTLEITTRFIKHSTNPIGNIRNACELGPYANMNFSYEYYAASSPVAGNNRPTCIIYHSGVPLPCNGVPNGGNVSGLTDFCVGQDFTLFLNSPTAGPGVTYQWQKSPISNPSWTNIAGATNTVITTNASMPTEYRCIVTCNNSGQSAISTSFTVTPHYLNIDSVTATIVGNSVSLLTHYNDSTFQIMRGNYDVQWNLLSSTTLSFTLNIDGSYNINVVANNTCNADTFVKTIFVGCQGSPTFNDSIISSIKTCPNNPVTLSLLDTLPTNYTSQWEAYLNFQWTTLSGLSGASAIVNPSTNTIYRNKSTCNISGNFKYSNYDTVYITPPPIAGSITATNTAGNYYSFTNNGMSNAQTYKWYFSDGDSSASLSPSHHYNLAGNYTVAFAVTNAGNGCTDTAFTTVNITTGIEEVQGKLFSVSPNPFMENFVVNCTSAKGTIIISDAIGKEVVRFNLSKPQQTIDMKGFAAGVYLVKYEDGAMKETVKVVKE